MSQSPNRVEAQAEKLRAAIASGQKVDGTGPVGDLVKLEADLALETLEYVKFQELKTWAFTEGLLTFEEAQTVYFALGDVPGGPELGDADPPEADGWTARTDLALKVTITGLMAELLSFKLRRRGVRV